MLTVTNAVGRLIEIRAVSPLSSEDISHFQSGMRALIVAAPQNVMVCADATELHILPPELFEQLLDLMRLDNYRIRRSALLVSPFSPSVELQFGRLISEAGNAGRRLFTDPRQVEAYMAEALTRAESFRLGYFLHEGPAYRASA